MPELAAFLDDDEATEDGSVRFFRKMDAIDSEDDARTASLDDVVLMTALFYEPLEEAAHGVRDVMGAVNDFLDPVIERIAMPRRIADGIRRIMTMVPRILAGQDRSLRAHRAASCPRSTSWSSFSRRATRASARSRRCARTFRRPHTCPRRAT